MKYFSIILIVLSVFACNNDDNSDTPKPDTLPALDVETVKIFMPLDLYENASKLIFKDVYGQEKDMTPNIQEMDLATFLDSEIPYDTKRIDMTLRDALNDNFIISMQANATYNNIDSPAEYLYGSISSEVNGGFTPFIQISEELEPVFTTQFLESVSLLGRTFTSVYFNEVQTGSNVKFEQFHYNTTVGFVAFKDENNRLWVFDRFE